MSTAKKIFWMWSACLAVLAASLFFTHSEVGTLALMGTALRVLLFILSVYLLWKEPNRNNRLIFLNFALFFSFSFLHHIYNFVGAGGSLFVHEPYARHYYYQYVDRLGFYFFLSLAIVYTVIDSLFRDFKVYQKYLFALAIVGGLTAIYYHPYFQDPKFLYKTEDILDWKALDNARSAYIEANGSEPSSATLANQVTLHAWKDGAAVGDLYVEKNTQRIDDLAKYLAGDNYLVLLWKPMHMNVIYMNVVCLFFLLLFFGYQYKKDPPQGAYVDKIMFLFLLFCSMEILHAWGYIKAVEWDTMTEIFQAGQYITIGILMFMILFFSLRLRFITSVKGEFYESELVHNAQHITRWRDWVDNLVVHYFLNPKALRGRLLALWTEKGKGELVKTAH
ncbi:MAG: hypothetical protein WBW16_09440 [Bacteroidota bacterium]